MFVHFIHAEWSAFRLKAGSVAAPGQRQSRQQAPWLPRWLEGGIALLLVIALTLTAAAPALAQEPGPASDEFRVNTYTPEDQWIPAVGMDPDGNFVIIWQSYRNGSGWDIYAQRYSADGTPHGSEFQVNTYTAGSQTWSSIGVAANGDFVITWYGDGQDSSGRGVYAQRYSADGTPQGDEFQVNTYTDDHQILPSIGVAEDNHFVITWTSVGQDGSGRGIYAQRYSADGTPQGSEFQVNTYTDGDQELSSIDVAADGRFVITWESWGQDGSNDGIYAQRYSADGTPQGSEFQVNTYIDSVQFRPSISVAADGDFVITWESALQDGSSSSGIYAQRYKADGTPQGSEFLVNTYTDEWQGHPSIDMADDGDFIITWGSWDQDGSERGIYAQRYSADGTLQGSEFQVNTYTDGDQELPSIGMADNGDFVITWASDGQDGSGYGIYARRFAAEIPPIGPTIGKIEGEEPGTDPPTTVSLYEKFEISFPITTIATNMYFPYVTDAPPGVITGTGITVDAFFIQSDSQPAESEWSRTDWNLRTPETELSYKKLPCFYYQPVDDNLLPTGSADWRCRFTPEQEGAWWYRIQAEDAGGTSVTTVSNFEAAGSPENKGFVRVRLDQGQPTRFFEFSDETPFFYPLVNVETGNPFNGPGDITTNIPKLGEKGVRFVRWFPTEEGANFYVIPFGGDIKSSWAFGPAGIKIDEVEAGHRFSFAPYYYTKQIVPAVAGARYQLTFRAKIAGEQVLRARINGVMIDICSNASSYHENNGQNDTCDAKQDGWHDFTLDFTNTANAPTLSVYLSGLYVNSNAQTPYDNVQEGKIRIHSIELQQYETDSGDWGANLLTRADPDTYSYVDQIGAARLDEIFELSEQYGVYHKFPLFEKRDAVLNRFQSDGAIGPPVGGKNRNFYSADGEASRWYQRAYVRYFIARWSYSRVLHSLELANEIDHTNAVTGTDTYEAGTSLAGYVHSISPRYILMSNSFWGYWNWFDVKQSFRHFWKHPELDYADKHWYANPVGAGECNDDHTFCEFISPTWTDSAAYVRECLRRFQVYSQAFAYDRPIVRGEGGVAISGTGPQHPYLSTELTYPDNPNLVNPRNASEEHKKIYYHKKVWSQVGLLGYTCDGEWYPRLFTSKTEVDLNGDGHYSKVQSDAIEALWDLYSSYEAFMQGEPVSNGDYIEIGDDLGNPGDNNHIDIITTAGDLRAWGVRDSQAGRALLWIDNKDHTWKKVLDGDWNPDNSAAAGTITIPGFQANQPYVVEWWDTYTGQIIRTEVVTASNQSIQLEVEDLTTDVAVKIGRPTIINDYLAKTGLSKVYDPDDPRAPAGVFTIHATFKDNSATPLKDLFFKVDTLEYINPNNPSEGLTVLNADDGPGGVGAVVPIPHTALGENGLLGPDESFTVDFEIGLPKRAGFYFFVDAYGLPADGVTATALAAADKIASFQFEITEAQLEVSDHTNLYLPLIVK